MSYIDFDRLESVCERALLLSASALRALETDLTPAHLSEVVRLQREHLELTAVLVAELRDFALSLRRIGI